MKNQLLKLLIIICCFCAYTQTSFAQTKKLVGKTEDGITIYKTYSKSKKTNIYSGVDNNGNKVTAKKCPPIQPGTNTPIPSGCHISCLKSFDGKSETCYLICPAKSN